ncbi:MAG: hypothetical protein SGPRY_002667, partial [Prymnesium sp.]
TFETSRGCAHMSSMGSGCLLALGLLASLCGGARGVLLSAASRGAGAHMSAALLERAPPAPPPATSGGRGRGGDGDSESEFLRLLSQQEMSSLLSDWASRAKIYKMSNNVVVQDRQAVCIDVIEKMEAHGKRITPGKKQLSIGLFDAERLWAMSCAEVSAAEGLVVHWLVVNPQELNDESSTAALRLLHGMHVRIARCALFA